MTRLTVVITDSNLPATGAEQAVLAELGAEVVQAQCHTEDQVIAAAAGADALLVQYAPITSRVLDHLPRCRIISRYGIGVDNIDLAAATARGILVANVPDYCIEEVATHALALLLTCARKVLALDRSVRQGRWDTIGVARPVRRLSGQTLGLIGFGRIARALARSAQGLGLRVIAYDAYLGTEAAQGTGVELVPQERLWAESDYLSLHVPLTPETRHMVNHQTLGQMKPTAVIINTARGPLIDGVALAEAINQGHLAGAALDVTEPEPLPLDHPLRHLDTVVLTPHASWYSEEALPELQRLL